MQVVRPSHITCNTCNNGMLIFHCTFEIYVHEQYVMLIKKTCLRYFSSNVFVRSSSQDVVYTLKEESTI